MQRGDLIPRVLLFWLLLGLVTTLAVRGGQRWWGSDLITLRTEEGYPSVSLVSALRRTAEGRLKI